MKEKIRKIFIGILCCLGIVALFEYGYKIYNNIYIKNNLHIQVEQHNNIIATFNNYTIAQKECYTQQSIFYKKDNSILISSHSLSSTKNDIKSQFFISMHTLSVDHKHYTDLFLSVYYPQAFCFLDSSPCLYYSVDDEIPIFAKILYWESKNNVLYFYFRPNIYDFIKKCSNAKKITFTIIDFGRKTISENFSLIGFKEAYNFGLNLLIKNENNIVRK